MAAAAARLVHGLEVAADPARLRRLARYALGTTGVYALALTLGLVAMVFALLAAHAGLRLVVPGWAASLVMSAVFVILALVAWRVARRRASAPPSVPVRQPAPGSTTATLANAAAFVPLLDAALDAARARPGETMLTALAAGVVAGSLRHGPAR